MVEFLLLIAGVWSLIAGEIPSWAGGKKFKVTGAPARWLGALLILPMPVSLVSYIFIYLLFPDSDFKFMIGLLCEFVLVIGTVILFGILVRRVGERTDKPKSGDSIVLSE